jgi:Spy/CpxP family protein refolding chaperone
MKKPAAVLAVVAIFLAGAAVGSLGAHLVYAKRMAQHPAPLWFLDGPPLRHLERRLDLSDEQRLAILEVIRDSRRRGEELRRQVHPQLRELHDGTQQRIREILTPEQEKIFDDFHRWDPEHGEGHRHRRRPHRREQPS